MRSYEIKPIFVAIVVFVLTHMHWFVMEDKLLCI